MVFINGKECVFDKNVVTKIDVASILNLSPSEFYLLNHGKIISEVENSEKCHLQLILRLNGGKGGFGSMLRAIGAQIEKTTNREACRDLSGRRLRDINEEKRLKAWIGQQADRERESEDRKKKKIEKLCQQPKHEFKDEDYEKERSELTERVEDALLHGLKKDKAIKRPAIDNKIKNKKPRLAMFGSDEELSSSDECSDTEEAKPSTSKSSLTDEVQEVSDSSNDSPKVGSSKIEEDNSAQSKQNEYSTDSQSNSTDSLPQKNDEKQNNSSEIKRCEDSGDGQSDSQKSEENK